jgi:hypothetical protein
MNHINRKQLALIFSFLLLFIFTLDACWADQGTRFTIENQTKQLITIYINKEPLTPEIKPGEKQVYVSGVIPPSGAPRAPEKYLIEAKNDQGQIIYSKEFIWKELNDLNWKIIILSPP